MRRFVVYWFERGAMKNSKHRDATRALHAGEGVDPVTGAAATPIVASATFVPPEDAKVFSAYEYDPDKGYSYIRWGSPTVRALEEKLASLEEAEDCVVFASGMAAATGLFLQTLKKGDHMVSANVCYPGIAEFSHDTLAKFGVEVTYVDASNLAEVKRAVRKETRLVFIDTPANPILRLADIAEVAKITHGAGAELAVDSTFATPAATKPLRLGADYVIHSLTKFLNGHGDVLGGALVGAKARLKPVRGEALVHLGANLGPFEAWLVLRGLQTFPARMHFHQENALHIARFLEDHPKVERVFYPGLESHPQHALAKRQMKNFGGMVSFRLKGGERAAKKALSRLKIITNAVSLGKTKSLIYFISTAELQKHSFRMNEQHLERYREWAGDGVIRFSVGLEDKRDLRDDLAQALQGV